MWLTAREGGTGLGHRLRPCKLPLEILGLLNLSQTSPPVASRGRCFGRRNGEMFLRWNTGSTVGGGGGNKQPHAQTHPWNPDSSQDGSSTTEEKTRAYRLIYHDLRSSTSRGQQETLGSATAKSPGGERAKRVKCPKSHVIGKEASRK